MTLNLQRVMAVIRQICALAAVVVGALSSALSGMKLPPAVSAILVAAGAALIAIEHYVADPSTGTAPQPPPVLPAAPAAVAVPPAPPAVVH